MTRAVDPESGWLIPIIPIETSVVLQRCLCQKCSPEKYIRTGAQCIKRFLGRPGVVKGHTHDHFRPKYTEKVVLLIFSYEVFSGKYIAEDEVVLEEPTEKMKPIKGTSTTKLIKALLAITEKSELPGRVDTA